METIISLYQQVYERFSLLYFKQFDNDLVFSDKEYTYLQAIASRGHLTPSDFATLTHMTRAGATQTLNKFEKRGWISKEPSSTDKRSLTVSLTPDLERHFQVIDQQLSLVYQEFFGVLADDEQAQLRHILNKLARAPLPTQRGHHDLNP